jgi:cytosine/adenosine deaminase-related metal-dependent hydrolase
MTPLVIENCAIAGTGGEDVESGHIVVEGAWITATGSGPAPDVPAGARRIDGRGRLATPGLVNTHHHLYQWATRGMATESTLFEWLVELYPVWAQLDDGMQRAATRAGLAALALSGCTLTTDHHYLFPRDAGDLLSIEIESARTIGLRFHPCRGSMDLGRSDGGLPPDSVVEKLDAILDATERAIDSHHDPAPDSMVRIAVAPCSPFSVTDTLMRESAALARSRGVRLHTHLAETLDEEEFCLEKHGVRPVDYLEKLGWLGDDVWLAHGIHLSDDEVRRFGTTGTGVAHCPGSNARLGAGIARVRDLLDAGAPVGLGVDGAASNESGELAAELREALLVARLRSGPTALTARHALHVATLGGAQCLGRDEELGVIAPGRLADIALWRMDGIGQAGIHDPLTALVMGPVRPVDTLIVQGNAVVEDGCLLTADVDEIAADLEEACRRLRSVAV